MSHSALYPQLKRVLPSSIDFARFQLQTNLLESVCLNCYKVLGTSSHARGLAILETAHRCPQSHHVSRPDRNAA